VVEKTSYAYNKNRIQYMAGMIERIYKDKPTRGILLLVKVLRLSNVVNVSLSTSKVYTVFQRVIL